MKCPAFQPVSSERLVPSMPKPSKLSVIGAPVKLREVAGAVTVMFATVEVEVRPSLSHATAVRT